MNIQKNFSVEFINFVEKLSIGKRKTIWIAADFLAFLVAAVFASFLFWGLLQFNLWISFLIAIFGFAFFYIFSSMLTLRSRINRYSSLRDLLLLFIVVLISNTLTSLTILGYLRQISFRFTIIYSVLSGMFVLGIRFLWQMIYMSRYRVTRATEKEQTTQCVLIGAGDGGSLFMESYHRHPGNEKVVAILDSDPAKWGRYIGGVEVIGDLDKLPELVDNLDVRKAIIAIPSLSPSKYEVILKACNELGIKAYKMPPVEEVLLGIHQVDREMRKINISDLLGRKEITLNEDSLRHELEGKTILITGAGGSIGSELVRQVSKFNPAKVLLLGHGENSIYTIYHQIKKEERMTEYQPIIADIQDFDRLLQIMNKEKPDIVYHAAAHKHVPLMEANPCEAYKNNIVGTYNVARAVDQAGVPKMVMISTDKAVNPPNIMGATKRVAELIVTGMDQKSASKFCAVRFGNVLGSRGSVVPAFKKQIEEGGPVQVTDFRMIRYFMTIPEASRLVIFAGTFAEGSEVFILDMGEPVKILDLAKKMILLSGHTVEEIGIVETGIRPGEKLYEELLTSSEMLEKQVNEQIFIGKVKCLPLEETLRFVDHIRDILGQPQLVKEEIIKFANESAK